MNRDGQCMLLTLIEMKVVFAVSVILSAATTAVQGQFTYTTNNGGITITGYTGSGGSLTIPTNINGLTVTSVGEEAFYEVSSITSVTIPASVTNIGTKAFDGCSGLTNAVISDGVVGQEAFQTCRSLASLTLSGGVASIEEYAFAECSSLIDVTIPGTVVSIGEGAFDACSSLTNITIRNGVSSIGTNGFLFCSGLTSLTVPSSVTNIASGTFQNCYSLTNLFFLGNLPSFSGALFDDDSQAITAYYLPGTTGWGAKFAGLPVLLWNPRIQSGGMNFGILKNQFGFNITGTTNIPIVVEACTNLANPVWTPIMALTLTDGLFHFSEPMQTNISGRYYRISSP